MADWKADKKVEVDGRTLYLWNVTEQAKRQYADQAKSAAQ
jgi:hypothetical protein